VLTLFKYLGRWSPGQKPQQVSFFKVHGVGYDATKRMWANEIMIKDGNRDHFKIPSDIKPGMYILRTEHLSLHGNGQYMNPGLKGLPQFYTHCYNIEITGDGSSTPAGVHFPGAYPKNDPGVGFILGRNSGKYASYVSPPTSN
jgi:lytic cellulose monooxygenase (C1-hydroxylating)